MMPAIARSITRATDAGTAGANNTNSATRKCALKLNCPLPLFTIIRSVVTYTVDPLASPPARKYPITLSFGDVNTDPDWAGNEFRLDHPIGLFVRVLLRDMILR